jgi:hypothetical protein
MLGLGDFYYELGVQVVEVCLATREDNGGLIGLQELHQAVVVRGTRLVGSRCWPVGCVRLRGGGRHSLSHCVSLTAESLPHVLRETARY